MAKPGEVTKQDQVLECLKKGTYTREEIAAELGISTASVSSQFTYLRWKGNFIKFDENRKLSLCTSEEYDAWVAAKAKTATAKAKTTSTKTPYEQYQAALKTLETQEKQYLSWSEKAEQARKDLDNEPDNEQVLDAYDEASSNATLLRLKIKKGKIRVAELAEVPGALDEPAEESTEEPAEDEVEVTDGEDDII